jgi:rhamnosyltransferase
MSNEEKLDVSVIIPAKNGMGVGVEKCLKGIFSQRTSSSYEVILIDSGSTDGTLEVVKAFPGMRLVQIKPEDFGHGKTRNLGAKLAKGEYLVFLNQDAWPVNEHWLENLIKNFSFDEKVVGVYSRHLPKEGCNLVVARDIERMMVKEKRIKAKKDESLSAKEIFFSTVSAAIRKSVFDQIPFRDNILVGEDQVWAKSALEAGFSLVYEPESMVYHSHNFSFKEGFIRAREGRIIWKEILGGRAKSAVLAIPYLLARSVLLFAGDLLYILKHRAFLREILSAMKFRTAEALGNAAGTMAKNRSGGVVQ